MIGMNRNTGTVVNHWRVGALMDAWHLAVLLGTRHAQAQVALTAAATSSRAKRVKLEHARDYAGKLAREARGAYSEQVRWNEQEGYGWANEQHREQRAQEEPLLAPAPSETHASHVWNRSHRAPMSALRTERNHVTGDGVAEGTEYADEQEPRSVPVRVSGTEYGHATDTGHVARVARMEREALSAAIARREQREINATLMTYGARVALLSQEAPVSAQERRTRHARLTPDERHILKLLCDTARREQLAQATRYTDVNAKSPEQLAREYNAAREQHTPRDDRHGLIDGMEPRHSERGRGSVKGTPSAARVSMRDSANRCALLVRTLRTVGVATHTEASSADYWLLLLSTMRREIAPTVRVLHAGPHGYTSHAACSTVTPHALYEPREEEQEQRDLLKTAARVSASREQERAAADARLAQVIGSIHT